MEFASIFSSFLPGFQIIQTDFDQTQVTISATRSPAAGAICPNCHLPSTHLHSYYTAAQTIFLWRPFAYS